MLAPMAVKHPALPSPLGRLDGRPARNRRLRSPLGRLVAEGALLCLAVAAGLAAAGPSPNPRAPIVFGVGHVAGSTVAGSRALADSVARRLLSEVTLPSGSEQLVSAPDAALQHASQASLSNDQVVKTEFWMVPEGFGAFGRWVRSLTAPGLTEFESGTDYSGAQVLERSLAWQLAPLPPGVIQATLAYGFVPIGSSRTGLRVDAEVIWRPPRPRGSLIAPSDRYATLTWVRLGTSSERGVVAISDRAILLRLITAVNGLPAVPGGVESCPASLLQTTLRFYSKRGDAPAAVLSYSGCDQFTLTSPGGEVLLAAGPVLGMESNLIEITAPGPSA